MIVSQITGENNYMENGVYDISEIGEVSIKGTKPVSGSVTIKDGEVKKYSLIIDNYKVVNDGYDIQVIQKDNYNLYKNGSVVYFNPETGKLCESDEAVSSNDIKSGCMVWHIFNDDEKSSSVNMILNHNTTGAMYWNSTSDYINGPLDAFNQLKEDTKLWLGVPERSDKYEYSNDSGVSYVINYSGLRARFITANEVANIVGFSSWNEKSATIDDWYYFDSKDGSNYKTGIGTSEYSWLFDNIWSCTNYGCNMNESQKRYYGYWTASVVNGKNNNVWRVTTKGRIFDDDANPTVVTGRGGIRPVITINKDILLG